MRNNWLAAIMQKMNGELWRAANSVCQHCDAVSKKTQTTNTALKYIHGIVRIRFSKTPSEAKTNLFAFFASAPRRKAEQLQNP